MEPASPAYSSGDSSTILADWEVPEMPKDTPMISMAMPM